MAGFFNSLVLGGKYKKELELLRRRALENPLNLNLQVRIADLLLKTGRRMEAIDLYCRTSDRYVQAGLISQAISLKKIILRLEPSLERTRQDLAELYAQLGIVWEEGREKRGDARTIYPERRIHPRYAVRCPVSFLWMQREFSTTTYDLGLGGMKIHNNLLLPDQQELIFQLSLRQNPIWPKGRIVQNRALPGKGNFAHIEFVKISGAAAQVLRDYLSGMPQPARP